MNLHTDLHTDLRTLASRAALAAALSWTLKAVAIGTAGGLGRSPYEGPLFLLGLACAAVAAALAGASYAEHRGLGWKIAGAVGGVGAGLAVGIVASAGIEAVVDVDAWWVWYEANLWVLALALVAVTVPRARAARPHPTSLVPAA